MTLDALSIAPVAPTRGGRIVECGGAVLRARGADWPVGALLRIGSDGLMAEVVGFDSRTALLAPLGPVVGLRIGAEAAAVATTGVSLAQGRTIDAFGRAIDGKGSVDAASARRPRDFPNSARGRIVEPLTTGIRAIDALLTIGKGQRLTIAAAAGVGKTSLVQAILRGADVDAAVVALIGERGREIADFAAQLDGPARARTTIVASTSDEAPAIRLRAADRANAIAEQLRDAGKSVLLIVDSLTRAAQAQREIGLALGEAAGLGAYPPSAFALIPRLVERAGVDRRSGGSITALYTVLAEAGDADDPIVDAARAATDGHIILSRTLAEQGVYPAIDIGKSLSRTMAAVVAADHLDDARRVRRLWSLGEEYRELALLGGYAHGTDAQVDAALAGREGLLDFVTQGSTAVGFGDSRAALAELAAA